jgi:hypothetical protein
MPSRLTSSLPRMEWYLVTWLEGFTFQGARKKPRGEFVEAP